ncbi:MAG: hypothetical protein GC160_19540 [Acidobacteria bacterium]|nr:hypothetical protein [Acidobacteriota bacterium]
MEYESRREHRSEAQPDVVFVVRCMSFGRRLALTERIRELVQRKAFLDAEPHADAIAAADAALLGAEVDREYLLWGLERIEGLAIDGAPATPESLVEDGPEELLREALLAVRTEVGLSEAERKNYESHSISCKATKPDGPATNAAA